MRSFIEVGVALERVQILHGEYLSSNLVHSVCFQLFNGVLLSLTVHTLRKIQLCFLMGLLYK